MEVLVIGSGAVGGLIGARLIENGHQVAFLTRETRAEQLVIKGLVLSSAFGRFRRPVVALVTGEVVERVDLVIIAVRACEYESALALAGPALGPDTIILPVIEGVQHLEVPPADPALRIIGAVFEGRVSLDADGILSQRPPAAELYIGALRSEDREVAVQLAGTLTGRGLKALPSPEIRALAWERFGYLAGGIATSVLMGQPLRDAVRFAGGTNFFADLLADGARIGTAAGFAPNMRRARAYERAFLLDGRPVAVPPDIQNGGRAADEGTFILGEMVAIARRHGVRSFLLEKAWTRLTRPDPLDAVAVEVNEADEAIVPEE